MAKTETPAAPPVSRFSKEQLLKSRRYQHRRDVLEAVLNGQKTYSHAEVEKIIDDFLKGKVK